MSSFIVEISTIKKIVPHPHADKLDLIYIKGWQCVCQRGLYTSGEKVVYIPIDSILPVALSDKMNITKYLKKGRVKTTKLRGEYSQGVLASLSFLPKLDYELGTNVADILGITKYEIPSPPKFRGDCQTEDVRFEHYTNIENIKNFPDILKNGEFVSVSEKIHGTNFRVGKFDGKIQVGSHRRTLKENNENLYWKIAKKYDFEKILQEGDILYGEIYGEGIQKLTYGCRYPEVRFFDLWRDGKYCDLDPFLIFCESNELPVVHYIFIGSWCSRSLKFTNGNSFILPSQIKEGIVIKPVVERTWGPNKRRVIFKNINQKYLMKDWDITPH